MESLQRKKFIGEEIVDVEINEEKRPATVCVKNDNLRVITLNGKKIVTRKCISVKQAICAITDPEMFISDEDILPGFASAIIVTALFNPIVKISSAVSILADLFSHFRYGPNLPEFKVIFIPVSGC